MNSHSRQTTLAVILLALSSAVSVDASPTCEDNPKFLWKNRANKGCKWLATRKDPWKKKVCDSDNYSARRKCPEACGTCGYDVELKTKCPRDSNSRKFKKKNGDTKSCHKYEENLECGYDYTWTGCNYGDMVCTPKESYRCNQDTLWWDQYVSIYEFCEEKPYGQSCDPSTCPPFEPIAGNDCSWYEGEGNADCFYDYKIKGCSSNTLSCQPGISYTCDSKTNKWLAQPIPEVKCVADDYRWGKPCALSDCPLSEPKDGRKCKKWEGTKDTQVCEYQHKIKGCTSDTLSCEPEISYTCQSETNRWLAEPIFSTACIAIEDKRHGNDCIPGEPICPSKPPQQGADCSKTGPISCPFNYIAVGCSPEEESCRAVDTYVCQNDEWQHVVLSIAQCPSAYTPQGSCDENGTYVSN